MANGCPTNNGASCSWQNYSNLIDYIKLGLGASTNAFEFNDEQMIDIIKSHTLPEFSKYSPLIRYYRVTIENNLVTENPTYVYQFKNFCYKIMKVNNVISTAGLQDMDMMYSQLSRQTAYDITDFLVNVNYLHMSTIALPDKTWRFFPPDKIEITRATDTMDFSRDFITELACIHDDPTTVNPDLYSFLRDLALADIMIFIGRIRSRFESFTSPFGEVQVASRSWVDEGTQLREKTIEALKNLPPDDFLFFLN
jgi:hypothetical protein